MELRPGYKQTDVGVIPKDWEVRPLLTTVRIANGQVSPTVEPFKSMVLVAPDHIEGYTGRLLAIRTAEEQRAISGKYVFESGDIVYSKIRPYLRKAILASFPGLCSADMYPLKPGKDVAARFVLAVLLGHHFSTYAESVSVRSGMPKINRAELADYSFGLPPLPEQIDIAAALTDVDALLDGLDRLIAKKRDLKQAAMQQLLTGHTRLQGFKNEWRLTRLGNYVTYLSHATFARADLVNEGEVRYLHYGDVHAASAVWLSPSATTMPFLPTHLARRFDRLATGDLVLVDASEDLTGIGKSVELRDAEGLEIIAGLHTITARFDKAVLADSFKGYLQFMPPFKFQLERLAAGTKVYASNKSHVSSVEMKLPDVDEQLAIATVLNDMAASISALEARRDKTRLLKQAMMQELLTGRTRLVDTQGAIA